MTGQEDTDPAETSRPGIPLGARDTPGRWPTSSPSSRPPPRPT
jgi:hypothetical protein